MPRSPDTGDTAGGRVSAADRRRRRRREIEVDGDDPADRGPDGHVLGHVELVAVAVETRRVVVDIVDVKTNDGGRRTGTDTIAVVRWEGRLWVSCTTGVDVSFTNSRSIADEKHSGIMMGGVKSVPLVRIDTLVYLFLFSSCFSSATKFNFPHSHQLAPALKAV